MIQKTCSMYEKCGVVSMSGRKDQGGVEEEREEECPLRKLRFCSSVNRSLDLVCHEERSLLPNRHCSCFLNRHLSFNISSSNSFSIILLRKPRSICFFCAFDSVQDKPSFIFSASFFLFVFSFKSFHL